MNQLIEAIKDDVNKEDGVFITFFTRFVNRLFQIIILLCIPLFLYLFWEFHKMSG
ncbi:hypothetical protein ACE38V_04840 [Cytobacillus sp. Hz8]|uniref:hypothetical protein n=1 Tax=Cytobacillus sp. Hz8 TaxID=3347168 RepID=UPI0035DFF4EB